MRSLGQVPQEAAGALYDRLGYSHNLIRQLSCSPLGCLSGPGGGAAKEADPKAKVLGGADPTLRTPDQGIRRYPPITTATVTAVAGRKALFQGDEACVLGLRGVWLGLAQHQRLGSGEQGEVQDHRGLYVQILQGLLEGEPRGDQAAPDHGVAQRQGHMTLADESFFPRQRQMDGELLVLMCLRHGTEEEGRKLGGEPAIRFTQLLELSGMPVGQDDQVVPTDYFNGLVASAAGRLPQPLSADLADLWDSLWFLLMATADGKPSENFSPLENEWDRQDQLRWFSRDDPPSLQQPELLKWRHWRPGKIREMEPTTQRALELHMRGKWAERLLAHFAPFAEHIAHMQDILGEDFRKEALDLLGDSRFRTLRQHCLEERLHSDSMAGTTCPLSP